MGFQQTKIVFIISAGDPPLENVSKDLQCSG